MEIVDQERVVLSFEEFNRLDPVKKELIKLVLKGDPKVVNAITVLINAIESGMSPEDMNDWVRSGYPELMDTVTEICEQLLEVWEG